MNCCNLALSPVNPLPEGLNCLTRSVCSLAILESCSGEAFQYPLRAVSIITAVTSCKAAGFCFSKKSFTFSLYSSLTYTSYMLSQSSLSIAVGFITFQPYVFVTVWATSLAAEEPPFIFSLI